MKLISNAVFFFITLFLFQSLAVAEDNFKSNYSFGVKPVIEYMPLMVCPKGIQTQYFQQSSECAEPSKPISPEQYINQLCNGAKLLNVNIIFNQNIATAIIKFKIPESGCGH